jgi:F-type H+-transporting ATPase subunit a
MEGRLFTFSALLSGGHSFIIVFHIVLVFLLSIIIAKLATRKLKIVPTGLQNIFEIYISSVYNLGESVLGSEYSKKYLPLVATIGLFVFLSNALGIIPGFESPTGNINVTLSLAVIVFVYYNYEGIKKNGVIKYFKHFLGPVWWLAPLMFPIEIVSHISRIVSLSFRLFGNIKGDDLFLMVLLMLTPWLVPLPAFVLLTFMAFLQTFIFIMLTLIYISSAVIIEEGH